MFHLARLAPSPLSHTLSADIHHGREVFIQACVRSSFSLSLSLFLGHSSLCCYLSRSYTDTAVQAHVNFLYTHTLTYTHDRADTQTQTHTYTHTRRHTKVHNCIA